MGNPAINNDGAQKEDADMMDPASDTEALKSFVIAISKLHNKFRDMANRQDTQDKKDNDKVVVS